MPGLVIIVVVEVVAVAVAAAAVAGAVAVIVAVVVGAAVASEVINKPVLIIVCSINSSSKALGFGSSITVTQSYDIIMYIRLAISDVSEMT